MRSFQNAKNNKKKINDKIEKKKRANKTISTWYFLRNVSNNKLENINEALRLRKAHGEDHSSWKLVPKDSCEVYKDRRRRQQDKQAQPRVRRCSSSTDYSNMPRPKDVKNTRKINKNVKKKGRYNKKSPRKGWSRSESSGPSVATYSTGHTVSMSVSTSRGSRASVSDVDMDDE